MRKKQVRVEYNTMSQIKLDLLILGRGCAAYALYVSTAETRKIDKDHLKMGLGIIHYQRHPGLDPGPSALT